MRVGHLNVSRPEWYDRNPVVTMENAAATGPTAFATYWSYTVPSGKLAYLDAAQTRVTRTAATATPGSASSQVVINFNSIMTSFIVDGTANAREVQNTAAFGIVTAGSIIQGNLGDNSTGGATNLSVLAKITEFDRLY